MPLLTFTGLRPAFASLHWRRGMRTAVAVGGAMLVCLLLHHPMGWAALGALQVIMVDNGGPYRSRLANSLTVLVGGSLAIYLGVLANSNLSTDLAITIAFCFLVTLARVLSQPLASSSVVILVTFIVAAGTPIPGLSATLHAIADFTYGGTGAAALTLLFWPVDPFRPARNAVANVFSALSLLIHLLPTAHTPEGRERFHDALAHFRVQVEIAHQSLADTPARMTARTIRARNLAVLNESADLLLARILRINEFSLNSPQHLPQITHWLSASIAPIEPTLRQRPPQGVSAFAPFGSFAVELHRSLNYVESQLAKDPTSDPDGYIAATLRDSLLNFEVAYEAVRAIWSGAEPRRRETSAFLEPPPKQPSLGLSLRSAAEESASLPSAFMLYLDTLRANLTLNSVMFRHALRLCAVVTIDVLLLHYIHISHGYWLPMTSIIVLQPYTGQTIRRSGERVLGTVAGGIVAAILAASIHSELGILLAVTIGAAISISLYAVDYVWYSFFLTPTIVMMTLPYLRDWHFAAVRMGMTGLGAFVAALAMLLLWPEFASLHLPALLARGATADAAYLRAMLAFWQSSPATTFDLSSFATPGPPTSASGSLGWQGGGPASLPIPPATRQLRIQAERTILAPARRLCGLAVNDAEDTLDHSLLDHSLPLNPTQSHSERLNRAALTFTTYLRRLTQTITTLAAIGDRTGDISPLIPTYAQRVDAIAFCIQHNQPIPPQPSLLANIPHPTESLARLDRQITVLENTTNDITRS